MRKGNNYINYLAVAVSFFTFLVYLKSLRNDFVGWDDNFYVTSNPFIKSLDLNLLRWAFLKFYSYNWHPLTWLSHALDYAFWGLNPIGHHLTNNIFHSINTFLVVVLVFNLFNVWKSDSSNYTKFASDKEFSGVLMSVTCGLLFGIHPVHVESVAWIAERKDMLYALFFLLSILFYIKCANKIIRKNDNAGPSHIYLQKEYMLSLGLFVLALLSKPMAITLPFVLLIFDYFPFRRIVSFKTFRTVFYEKIPFISFSIGSSIVTYFAQKSGHAIWDGFPFAYRMLVAARSITAYIENLVFPVNLLPFYPYPRDASLLSIEYFGAIFFAVVVTLLCAYYNFKNRKLWLAVWLYYIITLVPVLGVVQVGGQFIADRYLYLPSIGPFMLIGVLVEYLYNKTRHLYGGIANYAFSVVVGVVISLILYFTFMQIGIWKNGIALWTYVIEKEPQKVLIAYYYRGGAFSKEGKYQEAIDDYSNVITLNYQEYSRVYVDRGLVYLKIGKIGPALADFKKACDLGDDFGCKALRIYLK